MPNIKIIQFLQSVLPMSQEKASFIAEKFQAKTLQKGEYILKENRISDALYFIEEGCVRSYILDHNGDEITTNLYLSPITVNDFISFFKRQPTQENFQTLSECQAHFLTYQQVQESFHAMPEFREFGRMMLINNYSRLRDRMLDIVQLTAEQRYLKLITEQPDIFQQVPLKMIATYLGITDTSLSRIRKDLAKK
jgi:CRP-like cAMP-binding protein